MLDKKSDLVKALADKADSMDQGSVMKKTVLRPYIRNRIHSWLDTQQAGTIRAYNAKQLSRRDFLKLLGLAGTGLVAGTLGYGILPDYDTPTTLTGNAATCTVAKKGGNISVRIGSGETLQNKLYDVTAPDASISLRGNGNGWTMKNIGIKGGVDTETEISTNGSDYTVDHCYIPGSKVGAGAISGTGSHNGVTDIWINFETTGTFNLKNSTIKRGSNNGIYGAPGRISGGGGPAGSGGSLRCDNCYFENNNIAHIRWTGDALITNTTVTNSNNVPGNENGTVNSRGIYTGYEAPDRKITVRNCDFLLTSSNTNVGKGSPSGGGNNCFDAHSTHGDPMKSPLIYVEQTNWKDGYQGRVKFGSGNTKNPDGTPPKGVPLSPEEAACGTSSATKTTSGTTSSGSPSSGTSSSGSGSTKC